MKIQLSVPVGGFDLKLFVAAALINSPWTEW